MTRKLFLFQFRASLFMLHDVVNSAQLRNGKAAWHTFPKVGLCATLDAVFIDHHIFDLLKFYLDKPSYQHCYHSILDTFLSCQLNTTTSIVQQHIEQNNNCANYENAYCNWILPVSVGMQLCQISGTNIYKETEEALILIDRLSNIKVSISIQKDEDDKL